MSPLALLLIAAGALLAMLAGRSLWHAPAPTKAHGRAGAAQPLPAELERVQRLIDGAALAGELHRGLRPLLMEIADARLRRRGARLGERAGQERARQLLGEQLWELVAPDRPPPEDRLARGLSRAQLERIVATLEEL
jgi:hypothetical protein